MHKAVSVRRFVMLGLVALVMTAFFFSQYSEKEPVPASIDDHLPSRPDKSQFDESKKAQDNLVVVEKRYFEPVVRENATIFTLVRNNEVYPMLQTVKNFEDRFNKNFHYDWVFANNEPFSDEFIEQVSKMCSGTAKFVHLPKRDWDYPSFIDQKQAAIVRKNMHRQHIKYGDSENYRHMCRFFSGLFFKLDVMKSYKYYWRVEPGVEFRCSIKYDPFRVMREEDRLYGFTLAPLELHTTVATLYDRVKDYAKKFPERIAKDNNAEFVTDDDGKTFNMCHFWSNFEIGDMDFFRSDKYMHFFNYLDLQGGIYYERWGDAPIHTMAVSYLLPYTKLRYFSNTGYFHDPNLQCDGSIELITDNECLCSAADDSAFSGGSCVPKFFDIHRIKRPSYAPTDPYLPIHDSRLRYIEQRRIELKDEDLSEEEFMEKVEAEIEENEKKKKKTKPRTKKAAVGNIRKRILNAKKAVPN